ncbi:MAG TPA: carboxymuconolactone decarboxylase family protein [Terriglobia bacterium]|nr:carboxymuconolactone decarboxylase family protein [Terriglobia bacterium]
MKNVPRPPKTYELFRQRYPKLGEAWEKISEAGRDGPLDEKTARLVKLAVAIGAMREGAVHSSVRKALGTGISVAEIEQVVALAAGTLGMPSTVAVFTWVHDEIDKRSPGL